MTIKFRGRCPLYVFLILANGKDSLNKFVFPLNKNPHSYTIRTNTLLDFKSRKTANLLHSSKHTVEQKFLFSFFFKLLFSISAG